MEYVKICTKSFFIHFSVNTMELVYVKYGAVWKFFYGRKKKIFYVTYFRAWGKIYKPRAFCCISSTRPSLKPVNMMIFSKYFKTLINNSATISSFIYLSCQSICFYLAMPVLAPKNDIYRLPNRCYF